MIEYGFEAIFKDKNHLKEPCGLSWKHDHNYTVDDVIKKIKLPEDLYNGMYGFLAFALKLSHEAIHERRELGFLLGFGHAELPDVRCRKPIPMSGHLSKEGTDLDLLVHFVKSYFSLFGRENKLLWFDQNGRCCGLYERAPQDAKEKWLEEWDKSCYFVRITGRDRLDVLKLEETGVSKSFHRPRVRVKGDAVVDLKSTSDIQFRVFAAAAHVFAYSPDVVRNVSGLVAKIADRLRENGHGAGIVIVNMDEVNIGTWRSPIGEQEKSLVPKLHDREDPAGEKIELDNHLFQREDFLDHICLLAELDGAVYLCFEKGSMRLAPARHFFPLLKKGSTKPAEPNRALQNFYKWAQEGQEIFSRRSCVVGELRGFLQEWRNIIENIIPLNLTKNESTFKKELEKCKEKLKAFENFDLLKLYTACIRGLIELESKDVVRTFCTELAFLNSSGTRHHSLWGVTVSSEQRLFAISLSEDGRVSVFWDGRLIPSHEGSK